MVVVPDSGEFIAHADTQLRVNLHSDESKIPFAL